MKRILIVDDEEGILEVASDSLSGLEGVDVHVEKESLRAAERLKVEGFDLLITDIRMPLLDGIELLAIALENDPNLPVLMLTAYPTVETAVESMKQGATDYITKPFLPQDLRATVFRMLESRRLQQENLALRRQVEKKYFFDEILGNSPPMQKVFETIKQVAETEVDILVCGPTGTGKELVARSIHGRSKRRGGRFVPVDCGAIPENLLESELFGHERGAFTGAQTRSLGILELAEGGTFFLDEIAELPLQLQAKLLRVLQERKFRKVGGREEISVDARIIAATNRDLEREIKEDRFREDLYFRINIVKIQLPALKERMGDLPILIDHFAEKYGSEMGKGEIEVPSDVKDVLLNYSWPGNVRELQNVLKRAIALTRKRSLHLDDLPEEIVLQATGPPSPERDGFFAERERKMKSFEKEYLIRLLETYQGDVRRAAKGAGLPRGTLYRLLKKHSLVSEDFRLRE